MVRTIFPHQILHIFATGSTRKVFTKTPELCCMGFQKDMETKNIFKDIIVRKYIKIYQNLD